MENTPTITLADSHGTIQTHAVSNTVLMQVMELLFEHDDCRKVEPLTLPAARVADETPAFIPPQRPAGVDMPTSVTVGKRPGKLEIRFDSKPSDHTINTIKACGYHWAFGNSCWYGDADMLPAEYSHLAPVAAPEPAPAPDYVPGVDQPPVPGVHSHTAPEPAPEKDDAAFMASLMGLMAQS